MVGAVVGRPAVVGDPAVIGRPHRVVGRLRCGGETPLSAVMGRLGSKSLILGALNFRSQSRNL